jgi:hypothetical protein
VEQGHSILFGRVYQKQREKLSSCHPRTASHIYLKKRPMKFHPTLHLVGCLALLATGCHTTSVQSQGAAIEPKQLEIDGLLFSVQPMTDDAKLKQTFKVNLLAKGVLPVKVKVENRNASDGFIIDRDKVRVMTEKSGETNSAAPGEIARDLYTHHVTKGQQMGNAVGASLTIPIVAIPFFLLAEAATPAPGAVIDKAGEFNLTGKEFYTRTLDPGQRAEGFIYFRLPKAGLLAGPCHVVAQVKNDVTGQIIPFDLKFDLGLKSP